MRTGIFVVGAVILVLGLIPVLIFGSLTGSAESMFGGWAMMSEDYQIWRVYVTIGQIMAVIGVIIMIPAIILKKKSDKTLICRYCNYAFNSEADLINHENEKHLDKSPYKCEHCDFIGKTEEELWNHYNDKHPDEKKW